MRFSHNRTTRTRDIKSWKIVPFSGIYWALCGLCGVRILGELCPLLTPAEQREAAFGTIRGRAATGCPASYSSGYGAVGWGVVESPEYIRIEKGDSEDVYPREGLHLHRLKGISWKAHTESLGNALPPEEIRRIGRHVPIQTRECISNSVLARRLIERLKRRFGSNSRATEFFVDDPMIGRWRPQSRVQ